jgi:hypothetical protein
MWGALRPFSARVSNLGRFGILDTLPNAATMAWYFYAAGVRHGAGGRVECCTLPRTYAFWGHQENTWESQERTSGPLAGHIGFRVVLAADKGAQKWVEYCPTLALWRPV